MMTSIYLIRQPAMLSTRDCLDCLLPQKVKVSVKNYIKGGLKYTKVFPLLIMVFTLALPEHIQVFPQLTKPLNESAEISLNGRIEIYVFDHSGRMNGELNLTVESNDAITTIVFLPSAKGPVTAENTTSKFRYSNADFTGKFYSYGENFPWDHYELLFIFGFDKDIAIQEENLSVVFSDRILYMDWNLETSFKRALREEVEGKVNWIAIDSFQSLISIIEAKHLVSFYMINVSISRAKYSIFLYQPAHVVLWIPPILLLFILLVSFPLLRRKSFEKGSFIQLYVGSSFFIVTYLFSIREYAPPKVTWLEGSILIDIIISFALLSYILLREYSWQKAWESLKLF